MKWGASTLRSSWGSDDSAVLPLPWSSIAKHVKPKAGHHVVLLAAPGVGKTTFSLNMACLSGARTLYVSADTDPRLMALQMACLSSSHTRDVVESRLARSGTWRQAYASRTRERFPHVVMDFDPAPSLERVQARAIALCEVWGYPPELIILDTASHIERPNDDYSSWQKMWLRIQDLSRLIGCVVMVNHHIGSGKISADGTTAPELNDGMYKAEQFAEHVWGLHRASGFELMFTNRKNRGGKANFQVPLSVDFERATISEEKR